MKRLIIVDDEPSVLNGLRTYVDWKALGIELIGTADDGDTDLELIKELKPDWLPAAPTLACARFRAASG